MTIAPYPAFNGGAILPKKIFEGKSASEPKDAAPTEEDASQEPRQEQAAAEAQDNAEPKLPHAKKKAGDAKSAARKSKPKRPQAAKKKNTKKDEPEQSETPETSEEPATGPVSSAIKKLARSQVHGTSEILWISAKDVMQTSVVWASPDESVQQALTKLQQNDVGYLAVGGEEALEGIVSKADLAGAMSPYLRPMFARWRRPTDDATLKIKLKWIMSRPVRTAGLDTPLATILENMCRFGGRALPVVDEQGKVHGLVTAFDIFQMLLNVGADCPTAGKAAQGPPL
jgi:CBS domain-containing protein